jgi:hypothetical protein
MSRIVAPGRCPHVILLRGTLKLCGTRRYLLGKGPILVESGGEKPLFASRQDAHHCVERTKHIHSRLRAAFCDTSYWPKGLPDFQIMSKAKWLKLCTK